MKAGLMALVLGLVIPGGAVAELLPADCARLGAGMQALRGWSVTLPPAGSAEGWCVFDGAVLRAKAPDLPDLGVDRLRLRGSVEAADLVALDIDLAGLRLRQSLAASGKHDPIRAMFRLQSADLALSVRLDPGTGTLQVRDLLLRFSGGTEIGLSADIVGATLDMGSLASGRLTALTLDWRLDGRLLRPVMEAVGTGLVANATGSVAVDATRAALRRLLGALPQAMLPDAPRRALDLAVTALPVGRGRLTLSLVVPDGIGAARLIVAGVADDPLAPETLAVLFQGARLAVTWEPGLPP